MLDSFDAQKARLNENVGYALKSVMPIELKSLVVAVVSAVLCLCCRIDVRSECWRLWPLIRFVLRRGRAYVEVLGFSVKLKR